jgi:CrcB protein
MKEFLLVGSGGFVGATLRYLVSLLALRLAPVTHSPSASQAGLLAGTLAVNVLGCLAIGVLAGLSEHHGLLTPAGRLFLIVGLLGGFTTFSAFGLESFHLVRATQLLTALAHAAAHLGLGFAAVAVGYWLAGR